VVENFASAVECDWIITSGRSALGRALVYQRSAESKPLELRTNSEADLSLARADVVMSEIRTRIARLVGVPPTFFEVAKLLHYAPGQEFAPHHDFLDPKHPGFRKEVMQRGQRIVTFLLYLNDDFAGGETRFPMAGKAFKGRKGDAIFFANTDRLGRPDAATLHAGAPPSSGEKWLLSQWIRDKPLNAFQSPPPLGDLDPGWRAKL
jgi:prolyl 4-hydroxylase